MNEVPKPGRNGKPRQEIMSFDVDFIAGLAMDHGTIGRQRPYHSFSNEKAGIFWAIDQNQNIV
jgi:hypothetical protein